MTVNIKNFISVKKYALSTTAFRKVLCTLHKKNDDRLPLAIKWGKRECEHGGRAKSTSPSKNWSVNPRTKSWRKDQDHSPILAFYMRRPQQSAFSQNSSDTGFLYASTVTLVSDHFYSKNIFTENVAEIS